MLYEKRKPKPSGKGKKKPKGLPKEGKSMNKGKKRSGSKKGC